MTHQNRGFKGAEWWVEREADTPVIKQEKERTEGAWSGDKGKRFPIRAKSETLEIGGNSRVASFVGGKNGEEEEG